MSRFPAKPAEAAVLVLLMVGLAVAGFAIGRSPHPIRFHPSAVGSSTDQIPSAPIDVAPPYASRVNAAGCAQAVSITSQAGAGILLVNAGTVQLKLADGPVPLPAWPIAPGSWVHFSLGASGTYEVTGTRYSCTASGRPAPHFRLTVTVP